MRLSDADGRPVIGRESAETLGSLQHVVVNVPTRRITALHVAGRGRKARLIDWSAISGFGPDGIIVHGADPGGPRRTTASWRWPPASSTSTAGSC